MSTPKAKRIKEKVRKVYSERAQEKRCCAPRASSCCAPESGASIAEKIGYTKEELDLLPKGVTSLGCGNPIAFSEIKQGDLVLDLGSGPGMDVILAARKVGKKGKVIGLDMTPEMIEKAKHNVQQAGLAEIVELRLGEIEDMPIDDASVDWIISNCVINLSPDKAQVFKETYRVLKPGGAMLISDLVSHNLPKKVKDSLASWAGCIAGTLEESEYLDLIKKAGFKDVAVVDKVDATQILRSTDCATTQPGFSDSYAIYSINVKAVKPPAQNGK